MKIVILTLHLFLLTSLGIYADKPESDNKRKMTKEQRIDNLEKQIKKLSKELRDLRKEDQKIDSVYKFATLNGDVTLRELFRDKEDLIVIHNMGKDCPYCTSYADGINGILRHLEDRASVVLLSPDKVADQTKFAKSRGWGFKMVSTKKHGEKFNSDMGFYKSKDGVWPGFSVFHRDGDKITRVSFSAFDPGDEYCVLFPFILMLKDGVNGWHPKFEYKAGGDNQPDTK